MHRGGRGARRGHDVVNVKAFFVAALTSALDQGIATSEDVIRHATPDVLAAHLPRPLWARLLTACVGAPRVDAQLVVDTVGVSNLCEHVPAPILWATLAEVAARSLGGVLPTRPATPLVPSAPAAAPLRPLSVASPPPVETRAAAPTPAAIAGPSIPASIPAPGAATAAAVDDVVAELESEERSSNPTRARTPTGQRFRQTSTNIGRLAATNARRPQAVAVAPERPTPPAAPPAPIRTERTPPPAPPPSAATPLATGTAPRVRRGETEIEEVEVETNVGAADWRATLSVEDEQLVDWSSSEETVTSDEQFRPKR